MQFCVIEERGEDCLYSFFIRQGATGLSASAHWPARKQLWGSFGSQKLANLCHQALRPKPCFKKPRPLAESRVALAQPTAMRAFGKDVRLGRNPGLDQRLIKAQPLLNRNRRVGVGVFMLPKDVDLEVLWGTWRQVSL